MGAAFEALCEEFRISQNQSVIVLILNASSKISNVKTTKIILWNVERSIQICAYVIRFEVALNITERFDDLGGLAVRTMGVR